MLSRCVFVFLASPQMTALGPYPPFTQYGSAARSRERLGGSTFLQFQNSFWTLDILLWTKCWTDRWTEWPSNSEKSSITD